MKKFFRKYLPVIRKTLATVLVFAVMTMTVPFTTGCTPSQVINEVNTVLTEATNVLVVAEPGAPWVPQLQAAVVALKTAEATWQSGGTAQIVIDALNTVEAITAVIPMTAVYSPLIDVLVAGIEAVIVALEPTVPPAQLKVRITRTANPHVGRVTIPHQAFHSRSTDFKVMWNDTAKAHGLLGAVI